MIIGGGDTFATKEDFIEFLKKIPVDYERSVSGIDDWKPWLRRQLSSEYDVIIPTMPNKFNARYDEWKIWFEKFFAFLNDGVILIGHSLGGAFLAKYLSENAFPVKIRAVMLVAAVYDKDTDGNEMLSFSLPEQLNLQTDSIFLYQSKDDFVVPFHALEKYKTALPSAKVRVLEGKGHLNHEEFTELLEDIKGL